MQGYNSIFFCGISGIGMSGLALLAKNLGYNVSGSSNQENDNTNRLKNYQVDIKIPHNEENITEKIDLFVITNSIKENNIELLKAKKLGIKIITRAEFLNEILKNKNYKNIIIAGTHGKTTTTSIIGYLLNELNFKPTVLVGGIIHQFASNFKIGDSDIFVLESDESDGSFIIFPTDIGIITNIDCDHMEFYLTEERLLNYFKQFAIKAIQKIGLIICYDSINCIKLLNELKYDKLFDKNKIITYGIEDKNADIIATNIQYNHNGLLFDVYDRIDDVIIKNISLQMYGNHNILNTLASICVAKLMKINMINIGEVIANFSGVDKRFTIVGKYQNALVIDDYAHNPQKIQSAINSAKHFLKSQAIEGDLCVVFEPHRYTRVNNSLTEFGKSFFNADIIIITDIYSASENEIKDLNNNTIYNEILRNNSDKINNIIKTENSIKSIISTIDQKIDKIAMILFVGAGNSSDFAKKIVKI